MKTLAVVIHARKQSSRCPNKHLRDLGDGNTMIDLSINKVNMLTNVREKYLAVYDDELKQRLTHDDEVKLLERSYDSVAPGNAPHSVMYKHLSNIKSDYILNFNPCQPFIKFRKIQKVIDWFVNSDYDSAITVKKNRNFYWNEKLQPVNFTAGDRLSTTSGPWLYEATHSLVFYRKEYMLSNWQLFSNSINDPYPYVVDWSEEELADVDTEQDFRIVKDLYTYM